MHSRIYKTARSVAYWKANPSLQVAKIAIIKPYCQNRLQNWLHIDYTILANLYSSVENKIFATAEKSSLADFLYGAIIVSGCLSVLTFAYHTMANKKLLGIVM